MEEIINLFRSFQYQVLGILIAADVLTGIIGAIVKKEFVFRKLGMFTKSIVFYIFGFLILELYSFEVGVFGIEAWIIWTGFALIAIALAGSIIGNLGKLGLPLPKVLKKVIK